VSLLQLSKTDARRLAVKGALLSAPAPRSILEVVEWLGGLQIDPTNAVARAEQLVLWSRLGPYDLAELERLRWDDRQLFEYRAYIVPTSEFAVHRESMRRYPRGDYARGRYIREWVKANAGFRRYILRELRRRGPLPSRGLEDRAEVPWRTGGWNDGKNLGRMLDILWFSGAIAVVGRDGNERLWDLAERWLPVSEPRPPQREVARRILETQLRWCGLARHDRFGFAFDGPPPRREQALRELVREGRAVPAQVEGIQGEWLVHADLLDLPFRRRTTLLAPFDKLIADRGFAEELFDFRYRLEIYVPKEKREFGFYVLPMLHGDRLIGRVDPLLDRKANVLRVNAVFAEPEAPESAGPAVAKAIASLGKWLGAEEIVYSRRLPAIWRSSLRH
jgi:uncharacterized protein YcaQ